MKIANVVIYEASLLKTTWQNKANKEFGKYDDRL